MAGALFFPIYQIFPVWFHCTIFRRLCCFRLTTVLENCHSDTLHNISRHKLATVFRNSMCEISFMTRFKQQRCRCFTVRWEFGYWTACNNFKPHCTLPYCEYVTSFNSRLYAWQFLKYAWSAFSDMLVYTPLRRRRNVLGAPCALCARRRCAVPTLARHEHAVGTPRKRRCRHGRAVTSPRCGKCEIIRYIF